MRKPNPKIRWHLSAEEIQQIASLRAQRLTQSAIVARMKINPITVAKALKKLGLPTLLPLAHQEEILAMLKKGVRRRAIAKSLGVPYRKVYEFARQNGFERPLKKPLTQQQREKLIDDIVNHRATALALTRKYRASNREVLALAHETLACERFLPTGKNPLSSYLPQRHPEKRLG